MIRKKLILSIIAGFLLVAGVVAVGTMFPRPPKAAASLIQPILRDRMLADEDHYERGSPNWDLEDRLDELIKNNTPEADAASVILLDYYLGEHNGETQLCSVTSRGRRILPLLQKYREHRAGIVEPWYVTLRLKKSERKYLYDQAIRSVEKQETFGCD